MNQKYERQLKKGVLEILVLELLSKKQMYGYQLINDLKQLSNDFFNLKEGTLYPILYRLEDEALVISEWSNPSGKIAAKKYYVITNKGKEDLVEMKKLWFRFSKEVSAVLEGNEDESR